MLITKVQDDRNQIIIRVPPLVHSRQGDDVFEHAVLNLVDVPQSLWRADTWRLEFVRVSGGDAQIVTERR